MGTIKPPLCLVQPSGKLCFILFLSFDHRIWYPILNSTKENYNPVSKTNHNQLTPTIPPISLLPAKGGHLFFWVILPVLGSSAVIFHSNTLQALSLSMSLCMPESLPVFFLWFLGPTLPRTEESSQRTKSR